MSESVASNTAKVIKNRHTAAYADALIGAAQILDDMAKRLRENARIVRREGLTQYPGITNPIAHMTEFRCSDIKQTAVKAMRVFGVTVDHLSEIVFESTEPKEGR